MIPNTPQVIETDPQSSASVAATHPHSLVTPPPPHVCGATQVLGQTAPQLSEPPQRLLHLGVHGVSQVASILTYMSVVKDVERIGDYAKNIYDIAAQGADLSHASDRDELVGYRNRISAMITEAARAFADESIEESNRLISEGDALQDRFDAKVAELVRSNEPGHEAVPRALIYRYYKRIVGHLMNLLSAVVMPLDRLDYYDEEKPHRG